MAGTSNEPSVIQTAVAGALAWALPGLGHIYLGDVKRGLVLLVVIAVTFWGGVAIGGVQSSVQPKDRPVWFLAQVCTGSHALATYALGQARAVDHPHEQAGFLEEDVAIIYTGVAGLLNILVIMDALACADPRYTRGPVRAPPSGESG